MVFNTKRIRDSFWRNFPERAKQMPSKVLFVGKKTQPLFGHCARQNCNEIVGNSKWVKNHHFVLDYLTVLVYTKTIIHRSAGG